MPRRKEVSSTRSEGGSLAMKARTRTVPAVGGRIDASSMVSFRRIESALAAGAGLRTTPQHSARMSRVRTRGTALELEVRRAVSEMGLRYTVRNSDLPGSPDLANRTRRFAVFASGCFWHRHPGCSRATVPKSNSSFWLAKFSRNVERDAASVAALRRMGFAVVTVWECEASDPARLRRRLARLLRCKQ
jgi:DNA mismatch endonuclease (patch repair protein)